MKIRGDLLQLPRLFCNVCCEAAGAPSLQKRLRWGTALSLSLEGASGLSCFVSSSARTRTEEKYNEAISLLKQQRVKVRRKPGETKSLEKHPVLAPVGGSVDWSVSPIDQRVAGSIPFQCLCLGCRFDPWPGCVQEATDKRFSLSLPSCLSKLSKYILEAG